MTSMAEQLGYGWIIDLGNPAWMHERRDPLSGKWIDTPGDEMFPRPAPGKAGAVDRYSVPDPKRLMQVKSGYKNPADHPFWREHPLSKDNILAAYDAAPEDIRAQGRRWYAAVHDLAGLLADGDAEKGGILLSTYSPQAKWPINMMNARESVRRGHPIGPGEGYNVTTDQQEKAQKAMDGQGISELMTTAKTHSFGVLIKNGDDTPDDPYGHVVIDTHAANVAAGGTMRGKEQEKAPIGDQRQHEYVADLYRQAAHDISVREGRLMKPHELQAITWLMQVQQNAAKDAYDAEHGGPDVRGVARGRIARDKNAWAKWHAYAKEHNIPLEAGVSTLTADDWLLESVIALAGPASIFAEPPPFPPA